MKIVFVLSTVITLLVAIGIIIINNNSILENTFAQEEIQKFPLLIEYDENNPELSLHVMILKYSY